MGRADDKTVEHLLQIRDERAAGDDRADTIAIQGIGLRETVELNEGLLPVIVTKQVMRRSRAFAEILVGFVDDEGDIATPGNLEEFADRLGRIDRARRIVRLAKHEGARLSIDHWRATRGF